MVATSKFAEASIQRDRILRDAKKKAASELHEAADRYEAKIKSQSIDPRMADLEYKCEKKRIIEAYNAIASGGSGPPPMAKGFMERNI